MCRVQNGLTALFIAQRLGYISVVEILRHITDVTVTPAATEDKYKVIAPETMQEAPMSDSEEEGGECHLSPAFNAVSYCSFLSFFHSIIFWRVDVSTMRRQTSRIVTFLQADAKPKFSGPRSASIARSQLWLGLLFGCFQFPVG